MMMLSTEDSKRSDTMVMLSTEYSIISHTMMMLSTEDSKRSDTMVMLSTDDSSSGDEVNDNTILIISTVNALRGAIPMVFIKAALSVHEWCSAVY